MQSILGIHSINQPVPWNKKRAFVACLLLSKRLIRLLLKRRFSAVCSRLQTTDVVSEFLKCIHEDTELLLLLMKPHLQEKIKQHFKPTTLIAIFVRLCCNHPTTLLLSPYQPHQPEKSRYDHWMGETTRNISAFLSLGFGSSTVPFHILQADDMFYEEMCLGESDENKGDWKKKMVCLKKVVKWKHVTCDMWFWLIV